MVKELLVEYLKCEDSCRGKCDTYTCLHDCVRDCVTNTAERLGVSPEEADMLIREFNACVLKCMKHGRRGYGLCSRICLGT
ncbi:hypothetical protein [Caldivirga sp. MU80]|uniref:hypothetical protein n=1 Tax=Caldivirga sp. MU80 TaxID=1650354 RepID=UPI00138FE1A7|nr:hypothetical protein [Caldivirga sp. MU80]